MEPSKSNAGGRYAKAEASFAHSKRCREVRLLRQTLSSDMDRDVTMREAFGVREPGHYQCLTGFAQKRRRSGLSVDSTGTHYAILLTGPPIASDPPGRRRV